MGKYLEAVRNTCTTPAEHLPKLTQPPAKPGNVGFVSAPSGGVVDFQHAAPPLDDREGCPLEAYLRAMEAPEVLAPPGLPPSPYFVALWAFWDDQALHSAAWAAWWAAVARQRAHRPEHKPAV